MINVFDFEYFREECMSFREFISDTANNFDQMQLCFEDLVASLAICLMREKGAEQRDQIQSLFEPMAVEWEHRAPYMLVKPLRDLIGGIE